MFSVPTFSSHMRVSVMILDFASQFSWGRWEVSAIGLERMAG
jgi:hypothetical protein